MTDRRTRIETEEDLPDRSDEELVLKWRRRGDAIEGLVTREVDGKETTVWLPALVLTPKDRWLPAN